MAGFLGLARERCDHVVGLFALDLDLRNAIDVEDAAHERKLRAQVVGHRLTLRLVVLIARDARERQTFIEAGDDVGRLFIGDQFSQRRGEHVRRLDADAARRRQRAVLHREEGRVDETIAVEQHQTRRPRRRRVDDGRSVVAVSAHQRSYSCGAFAGKAARYSTLKLAEAAPTSPSSEIFRIESTK